MGESSARDVASGPEQVVQRQLEAYNAKDIDAWLATYHPEAEQFLLHGARLARGHAELRARIAPRFTEPDLHAELLHRTVMGAIVIDHERITRNFPAGRGHIEMLCLYEVSDGLIVKATFAIGEPRVDAAGGPETPVPRPLDAESAAVSRLLRESDAYLTSLYPAESNHLESVQGLRQPNVHLVGIEADGQLVACGAVKILGDDGVYGEMKRVFVLPAYRGRGYSKAIVRQLEQHLRTSGVRLARLETGISQPEALGLYRSLGYRARGPFGAYGEDPLCVFMEKALVD